MQRANACISNELRTPLKTIDLYTDILLRECKADLRLCEIIDAIKVGANMIRFNIQDLQDISNIRNRGFNVQISTFKVKHCLQEIINLNSMEAA